MESLTAAMTTNRTIGIAKRSTDAARNNFNANGISFAFPMRRRNKLRRCERWNRLQAAGVQVWRAQPILFGEKSRIVQLSLHRRLRERRTKEFGVRIDAKSVLLVASESNLRFLVPQKHMDLNYWCRFDRDSTSLVTYSEIQSLNDTIFISRHSSCTRRGRLKQSQSL